MEDRNSDVLPALSVNLIAIWALIYMTKNFKKIRVFSSIAILAMIGLSACEDDECKAGKGGDLTLRLEAQHHAIPIYSSIAYRDTAYIKFEATDFPGPNPSSYDMVVVGNANENFVNVSGLKCGQYYVMMTGFDTSAVWNVRVIGGLPINISEKSGTKTLVVPVNE
jgi:hypothetical protein